MKRLTLEALGLSAKELVVLGVLRQNPTAQKISILARQTKLPASTVAFIMRGFEKRKLVQKVKVGGHFEWKYRRAFELNDDSSESSFGLSVQVIDGMSKMKEEFLKILTLPNTGRLYCIQGSGITRSAISKMDPEYLFEFHRQVKKHQIIIEGVISESVLDLFNKMSKDHLLSHMDRLMIVYVIPDGLLDFPLDLFLYGDRVLMVDYEMEKMIKFDNISVVRMFRSLFDIAEHYGRRINLNDHIKELIAKV